MNDNKKYQSHIFYTSPNRLFICHS